MFSGGMDARSSAGASSSAHAAAGVAMGLATLRGASSMSEFSSRAERATVQGGIDGKQHVAAATSGDGACGLHAVFGVPSKHGGPLQLPQAREAILSHLPESFEVLCGEHHGALREFGGKVMESMWTDMALPAARASVHTGSVAGCTPEVKAVWDQLHPPLQEELKDFVEYQQIELKRSNVLKDQLLAFAAELFVPDREATVVRPLCMLLGYLDRADRDFLRFSPSSTDVPTHEGTVGDLALLHPCAENASITKYQALFDQSCRYDRYRLAFFMNGAHNAYAGRKDWMLGALDTLAQDLATSDDVGNVALLRNARATVQRRYECFGGMAYPSGCIRQRAWSAFRAAFQRRDYWLSVEELQLVAACAGCTARVVLV